MILRNLGKLGKLSRQLIKKYVFPQIFGISNDYADYDQTKGLREDLSRIIVAREGIIPASVIWSRTYSKKLISNLWVLATRDIKVSQALVPQLSGSHN